MIGYEVPIEELLLVEESDDDKNEDDTKKYIDEDLSSSEAKVKTGATPPVKQTTNKVLLITKPGPQVEIK